MSSNKNFGYTFAAVFALAGFIFSDNIYSLNNFYITSLVILIITLTKPDLFLPFNKIWFKFSLLLSKIISPIFLTIFYYFLFSPYSLIIRLFDKNYNNINLKNFDKNFKTSWSKSDRTKFENKINFNDQF